MKARTVVSNKNEVYTIVENTASDVDVFIKDVSTNFSSFNSALKWVLKEVVNDSRDNATRT